MLVLCYDPKQPPTTAGDWPSILLYLLEQERPNETHTQRNGGRGWPRGDVLFNQTDVDEAFGLRPL